MNEMWATGSKLVRAQDYYFPLFWQVDGGNVGRREARGFTPVRRRSSLWDRVPRNTWLACRGVSVNRHDFYLGAIENYVDSQKKGPHV